MPCLQNRQPPLALVTLTMLIIPLLPFVSSSHISAIASVSHKLKQRSHMHTMCAAYGIRALLMFLIKTITQCSHTTAPVPPNRAHAAAPCTVILQILNGVHVLVNECQGNCSKHSRFHWTTKVVTPLFTSAKTTSAVTAATATHHDAHRCPIVHSSHGDNR
jgi:hypothetical protein